MRELRAARSLLPLLPAVLLALTSNLAHAQAGPTASRSAGISVFGGYLSDLPDYGPYRNNGFSFGVDYTQYFKHLPVAPSLELRANIAQGKTVNEHSYGFGPRIQYDHLGPLHPYADLLIGPGNIHFNFPYNILGDNSTIWSYGGGLNYDLSHHFQALIDFQGQHWKTGHNVTLSPSLLIIGVRYNIPFRPHIRQRDFYH
ncbi:MAG TPA: outer membrane beta-barrel protein [Acidobacteriaceae bacterium]